MRCLHPRLLEALKVKSLKNSVLESPDNPLLLALLEYVMHSQSSPILMFFI